MEARRWREEDGGKGGREALLREGHVSLTQACLLSIHPPARVHTHTHTLTQTRHTRHDTLYTKVHRYDIYIQIHTRTRTHTFANTHKLIHTHVLSCTYVQIQYIHIYPYNMYIYVCVCVFVCVCVCVCVICVYVYPTYYLD
jgi:hypothetical protein